MRPGKGVCLGLMRMERVVGSRDTWLLPTGMALGITPQRLDIFSLLLSILRFPGKACLIYYKLISWEKVGESGW